MTIRLLAKRFGTDILGYTCLVLVVPVGLLPGPGGVPLLLAGLGLLAVHNTWARRLLNYTKEHSKSIRDVMFPNKLVYQRAWDLLASVLVITAVAIALTASKWQIQVVSTSLFFGASVIFISNRSRINKLTRKTKQ